MIKNENNKLNEKSSKDVTGGGIFGSIVDVYCPACKKIIATNKTKMEAVVIKSQHQRFNGILHESEYIEK